MSFYFFNEEYCHSNFCVKEIINDYKSSCHIFIQILYRKNESSFWIKREIVVTAGEPWNLSII